MFRKIACFFIGHIGYGEIWFKKKDQYFLQFIHKEDKSVPVLNVDFCLRCNAVYCKKQLRGGN